MLSPRSECYLIEVGHTYFTRNGEKGFKRNDYIPYRAIYNYCNENHWTGAFRSAYSYNTCNADTAKLYGDFYLDFDSEDNIELAVQDCIKALHYLNVVMLIKPENVQIFFSGCKGVHVVVPAEYFGIEPTPHLNEIYKYIASNIKRILKNQTLDLIIYDKKRLFRIPNTVHEKTGLYKVQISYDQLTNCSVDDLKAYAVKPKEIIRPEPIASNKEAKRIYNRMVEEFLVEKEEQIKKNSSKRKGVLKFMPPCIKYILDNGAQKGQRNITISCLVVYFKNTGLSLDETLEQIKDWNSSISYPIGTSELIKTVKSMYNTDKNFGCSTLESVSECDPAICKLHKKEKRKDK